MNIFIPCIFVLVWETTFHFRLPIPLRTSKIGSFSLSARCFTWMSRDVGSGWINGDRINGLFHLLINGE